MPRSSPPSIASWQRRSPDGEAPIAGPPAESWTLAADPLIAVARSRPGKLTYGSGGTGGAGHLATEYFKLMTSLAGKVA